MMFEMIKLVTRSRAFHFVISRGNFDVQAVISPYSHKKNLDFKVSIDTKVAASMELIRGS